jgi:hypothetical protein
MYAVANVTLFLRHHCRTISLEKRRLITVRAKAEVRECRELFPKEAVDRIFAGEPELLRMFRDDVQSYHEHRVLTVKAREAGFRDPNDLDVMSMEWDRACKIILKGQIDTGKICPPGFAYCWECGHVALADEFFKGDSCPNPSCPCPCNWDD